MSVFSLGGDVLSRWPVDRPAPRDRMAIDQEGRLYATVADSVKVFTPEGELLGEWGSYGDGPGQFGQATGIAVDESGRVYVGDFLHGRIQVFQARFD